MEKETKKETEKETKKEAYFAPVTTKRTVKISVRMLFGSDTPRTKTNVDTEDLTEEDWSSDFSTSM